MIILSNPAKIAVIFFWDGAFSFPSQTEEAAIPLVKTDLNAKSGGIGSKPCEFEK